MEGERPSYEESKDDDDKTSAAEAPRTGLWGWIERFQAQQAERLHREELDDNEEESSEGKSKKKRLRKLFSMVFGNIASVERQEPEATPDYETDASIKWLAGEEEIPAPRDEMELPEFEGELAINHDEEPSRPTPESAPEEAEGPEPEYTESDTFTPEYSPEEPEVGHEGGGDGSDGELPPSTPENSEPELAPEPERAPRAPLPLEMVSPHVIEQAAASEPLPAGEETIIDRRAGWGPAIIVDQLSRRRDRKQKRETGRINREVEQLKKRATEIKQTDRKIEQVAETAKNQLETVRVQAANFDRRIRPIEGLEEKLERQPERQKVAAAERKLEGTNETIGRESPRPPELPPPLIEINPEVAPAVVLQEVESAAEKNRPIEAAFELSHEVKDEDSKAVQNQGAASVGAVLADLHQKTVDKHAAFSKAMQASAAAQLPAAQTSQSGMYKKAATSGFWTGLVIVGILIVIGIVT